YPLFPSSELEKVKTILIDKLKRAQEDPHEVAIRLLKNRIYKGHPYAWTFQELIQDIGEIDTKKIKELHDQYLSPANMVLSVVGNFDIDAMVTTLESIFGDWDAGKVVEVDLQESAYKKKDIDNHMLRDQIVLIMGQPSEITFGHPDLVPLKLLNIICFLSGKSRLHTLREQTGIYYRGTGSFAASPTKEHGYDIVLMLVSPDRVDEAEKAIKNLIQDIAKQGVSQEELNEARQIYLKGLIDAMTSDIGLAQIFCRLDSYNVGFDYYDQALKNAQSITVDQLNVLAKKYCRAENMSRIRVGALQDELEEAESEQ
ncbi:MAG: pitrilysin family protein, partial [Pseudomonadota bacterium]